MRRFAIWTTLVVLVGVVGCKHELRDDDAPTSTASSQDEADEASEDPLAVAQSWLTSTERPGLNAETKPIADSWTGENPAVIRIFRDEDSYFALVGNDSSNRVVPALLLKLEASSDGWTVTNIEKASSDLLWPSI